MIYRRPRLALLLVSAVVVVGCSPNDQRPTGVVSPAPSMSAALPSRPPCAGEPLGLGRISGDSVLPDRLRFTRRSGEVLTLFATGRYVLRFEPDLQVVDQDQGFTIAVAGDVVEAAGVAEPTAGMALLCSLTRVGSEFPDRP